MLWGTMVFFLVAMAAPRLSRGRIALIAGVVAIGVELFRLVHTPWLDDFRLTLAGALLLGRIFSSMEPDRLWRRHRLRCAARSARATMLNPRATDAARDTPHSAS